MLYAVKIEVFFCYDCYEPFVYLYLILHSMFFWLSKNNTKASEFFGLGPKKRANQKKEI